ncbi:MAG: hypothetical protein WBQ34_01695 [Candidatus Acidiferrales bacterium]
MGHWTRMLLILLTIFFALSMRAHATTYYIAANGSDSNSGTVNTSPWLHAPGMPNCTANCASKTPQPGDSFIFRGGDAWHRSASTSDSSDVPMGGEWTWKWSGSGGGSTCNYPSVTSTCIYIGVDTMWYNSSVCGSSFCRPQVEFDNPIWANSTHQDGSHAGFVTACSYDDYNTNAVYLDASDIQFDNFNMWGKCWATPPVYGGDAEISRNGNYIAVTKIYIHGWTESYNPLPDGGSNQMDDAAMITDAALGTGTDTIAWSVFDGSDSHCTGVNNCTGGPVQGNDADSTYFYGNVCRYMTNCIASPHFLKSIHDNLFEYVYESYDPSEHGNVVEQYGAPGGTTTFYNNVVRHVNAGIILDLYGTSGGLYIFNNTFFDIQGISGGNCVMIQNDNQSQTRSMYFTNNTVDNTTNVCAIRAQPNSGQGWNGTVYFQNNHLIGITSLSAMESCSSGSTCTWTDNGNEVFQTESAANNQGYTSGNDYQPTSASGATYHQGGDLSLQCATYSLDLALCSGSTGGVIDVAASGTLPVLDIQASLRGAAWDAGAYQYSGDSSNQPIAPLGLTASVQ